MENGEGKIPARAVRALFEWGIRGVEPFCGPDEGDALDTINRMNRIDGIAWPLLSENPDNRVNPVQSLGPTRVHQ